MKSAVIFIMGTRKPTRGDVAELAKISTTTVSHVINKTRFVETSEVLMRKEVVHGCL